MTEASPERPNLANKVRFVTATTLFDGHDASINIFRRILQASGAEVIHLGHNRTGLDIVETAIEEDAHAIAVTSYQGGHMEFYRYLRDLLAERDAGHIRIFGGGGGTILPHEGEELAGYGITRVYSPDDGREMGMQGMVSDMLARSDFATGELGADFDLDDLDAGNTRMVATLISAAENFPEKYQDVFEQIEARALGFHRSGGGDNRHRWLGQVEPRRRAVAAPPPRFRGSESRRDLGGPFEASLGWRIAR